jgi:hypothetical protein
LSCIFAASSEEIDVVYASNDEEAHLTAAFGKSARQLVDFWIADLFSVILALNENEGGAVIPGQPRKEA